MGENNNRRADGLSAHASMDSTEIMLVVVGWANKRIARLGLERSCCIIFSGNACDGEALLLGRYGGVLDREPGEPRTACAILVLRLERGLRTLLQ